MSADGEELDELPPELEEDIRSHEFSTKELKILCEMPCEVRMSECNRLWSYEQMMFGLFKQKGEAIKEKHLKYIHAKFFRKWNYHYKKQLELEEEHKKTRDSWLLYFKISGAILLAEKRKSGVMEEDNENSSVEDSIASFHIDYTLTEDVAGGEPESLSSRSIQMNQARDIPVEQQNQDSDDDLNEFIHEMPVGIEAESEPLEELNSVVNTQLKSQSPTYTQFQGGVNYKSTQEPMKTCC